MIQYFAMLSYTDLTPGTEFIMDGEPYIVLDYQFVRMQQRRPTTQIKARSLITGKITSFTAQQSDGFGEAKIEKEEGKVQPPEEALLTSEQKTEEKSEVEAVSEAPDEMDTPDEVEGGPEEK